MLGGGGTTNTTQGIVENIDKTPQIKYYNYAPNTIKVENGSDIINFKYTPSSKNAAAATSQVEESVTLTNSIDPKYVKNIDATSGQTIAYEYVFGNAMNRSTAVNLKSIGDTTGVKVSYLWRTSPLTQGEAVTNSPTKFTCQEIENKGDTIYLYVIVSSESSTVPADFTTEVVWYYGIPQKVRILNNINDTVNTMTIVTNQQVTPDDLLAEDDLSIPTGYNFDSYFWDSEYTQLAQSATTIKKDKPIYVKYHNCSVDNTNYMTYDSSSDKFSITGALITSNENSDTVVVPTKYTKDGNTALVGVASTGIWTDGGTVDFTGCVGLTTIQTGAFRYGYSANVNLSNCINLKSVGTYAFYGCGNVNLSGCTSFNSTSSYAFAYCNSVDLSNCTGLDSIGANRFVGASYVDLSGCTKLASVGERCFEATGSVNLSGCTSLTTMGENVFYNSSMTAIDLSDTKLTSVSVYAFDSCVGLKSIVLPKTLQTIESKAFEDCGVLSIDLSDSTNLVNINSNAFKDCTNMTSIDLSGCTALERIGDTAFTNCSKLTNINLSGCTSLNVIRDYAFNDCGALVGIDLSDCTNLETIRDYAFNNCGLVTVKLPASLTYIGNRAFYDCSNITSVYIPTIEDWLNIEFVSGRANPLALNTTSYLYINNVKTTSIVVPQTIANVGKYSFYKYNNMTSISLPSLGYIGSYAFQGCTGLTSITLAANEINTGAFYDCTGLTSVNMSTAGTTTNIGNSAFYNCSSLSSVTLSDKLNSIGGDAFNGCSSLTSITIPSSVTNIGRYAFRYSGLTSAKFNSAGNWMALCFGDGEAADRHEVHFENNELQDIEYAARALTDYAVDGDWSKS